MPKLGWIRSTLQILLILSMLLLGWIGAYYATGAIFDRVAWEPHSLIQFLINAVFGFLIFGSMVMIIGPFVQPREHYFYVELFDALKRISKGDFRVKLDLGFDLRKGRANRQHPLVQLVDSVNDMAANLKAMEELRQEFISNVSHEIGSPLTAIRGFAEALKNEQLDPELRHRYLTIIETECVRLSKLSDNLMKLAVLDSDHPPFQPTLFRLDKQLVKVILACEPLWEPKQIDMNLDLSEVEIRADADLLSQVWINLLHNAIKFSPPNGAISVRLTLCGDCVDVCISDSGPGIAEQDRAHIFERFYKADKSRDRSEGGNGLGLSIVQKIVEIHEGMISVSSKTGEGAQFNVLLPVRTSEHKK